MALNAPALTETLIEAGINPSAARRVVDILERDHADLLTEAQLDRRLHEQDRLNQVRFDSIDERFDKIDARLDKADARSENVEERLTIVERGLAVLTQRVAALEQRVTDLQTHMNQRFADTNQRITDLQTHMDQRFADLENSINKRLWLIISGMGISLAVILAMLGWIISRLP